MNPKGIGVDDPDHPMHPDFSNPLPCSAYWEEWDTLGVEDKHQRLKDFEEKWMREREEKAAAATQARRNQRLNHEQWVRVSKEAAKEKAAAMDRAEAHAAAPRATRAQSSTSQRAFGLGNGGHGGGVGPRVKRSRTDP
jgi:hypothetical protein